MAFFWVNQGATYVQERAAGILWAPEVTSTGASLPHWDSMLAVAPGDVIFNYADGHLKGYAVATSTSFDFLRPYAAGSSYSASQGGRAVFCAYTTIAPAISFAQIAAVGGLIPLLQAAPNPVLDVNGQVALKYLCPISQAAGAALQAMLGAPPTIPPRLPRTLELQLRAARDGQGIFRTNLLAFGACAVTGLTNPAFLIASHIRPWAKSEITQKLDVNNGLLLAAGVDSAFDGGYIGFDATWQLVAKPGFGPVERNALGIPLGNVTLLLAVQTASRAAFLAWHKAHYKL